MTTYNHQVLKKSSEGGLNFLVLCSVRKGEEHQVEYKEILLLGVTDEKVLFLQGFSISERSAFLQKKEEI